MYIILIINLGNQLVFYHICITCRLWVHEILRVFCDRLIDLGDKEWLFGKLKCAVEEEFKEKFEVMMEGLEINGTNQV